MGTWYFIMNYSKVVLSIFLIGLLSAQKVPLVTDSLTAVDQIDPIDPIKIDPSICEDQKWEFNPDKFTCCQKKGVTWALYKHECKFHIDNVGCWGSPAAPTANGGCDAYNGDTDCSERKPILCLNKQWINRPPYAVDCSSHAMQSEFYCGWSGAFMKLTPPVQGCMITSEKMADQICRYYFGCGWQMAAHHDGWWLDGMSDTNLYGNDWAWKQTGGWAFRGFSNLSNQCSANPVDVGRFWVKVIDQPSNCWN